MAQEHLSLVIIKVNGKTVKQEIMDKVEDIVLDLSLVLPDMLAIHFRDSEDKTIGRFELMDSDTFKIGADVEISMQEAGANKATALMKGEITAIEPEFLAGKIASFTVRGYDKSHRLHRKKQTKTYQQTTDSQLAEQIASDLGLRCTVDNTSQQYNYVLQDNQTAMEFLQDRAWRVGYYAYAKDGQLYFVKQPKNGSTVDLEWGENLIDFQARLTIAEQVSEVEVHGWDPDTKQAIVGKVTSPAGTVKVEGKLGSSVAQTAFSKSEDYISDQPVRTSAEAKSLAQSIHNRRGDAFFTAEGTCEGNPKIKAGTQVKIIGMGKRFSGTYCVSRAVHRYGKSGYKTHFEISGNHANTLGYLLASKDSSGQHNNGRGMVVGVVTNLNDPDGLARVKVKYPSMPKAGSADIESNWARLVTPMAGPERGIEFIPEVDDEVLVAFENGDINYPYILGALWNKKDKPPEPTSSVIKSGKVQKRIIKSTSGHIITIDDTEGKEKISIIDKTGKNSIDIDSAKNTLTIIAGDQITIEGKGDLTIKGNNITLEAAANANMKAKSNINLEASGGKATVKGTSGADVEGAQVNVKGTGTTNIEGATTTVKANTMLTIQGTPVKIN